MIKLKNYAPYLAGVGYAIIFGFSFMFSKISLGFATTFQLMGLRFLIAAVIFEVLRLFKVIKINVSLKDLKILLPIAIFQPVLYFLGETYGIYYSSSSMTGIVISLIPVFTAILAYFVLKEKLSKLQLLFMIISLSGIVLISFMALYDFENNMVLGLLFLLLAVASCAIYNVLSRKASTKSSPVDITYVMMMLAAIVFNAIGFTHSIIVGYDYFAPFKSPMFIIAIGFLGIISSIIAYFLMNFTLSKISATQNSLFANLVTVISIFAGAVILKEQIFLYQIIGSILIILGVWGVNFFKKN